MLLLRVQTIMVCHWVVLLLLLLGGVAAPVAADKLFSHHDMTQDEPELSSSCLNVPAFAHRAPHASRPCDLCLKYLWVFVVSTPRSGATTMAC